jgi:hypothetical protein
MTYNFVTKEPTLIAIIIMAISGPEFYLLQRQIKILASTNFKRIAKWEKLRHDG